MSDVLAEKEALRRLSNTLGEWSKALAQTSRDLEPVEAEYRAFVDDFELGLLLRSENEDDYRLPPASLRLKLAHKAMDPALLGRYMGLTTARGRQLQRIRDLGKEIEAHRSLLSAAKTELDAIS